MLALRGDPPTSRKELLRGSSRTTNSTIASFKKRIASFEKSSNIKIKSFANSNNKTKNAGVESKVGGNVYRGKGRGKTREDKGRKAQAIQEEDKTREA